ncbi:nucleolar GTP-binding protein 1 [Echria macrotheca]|uniref:Nucleolar GTP-binding protein 1 n=1 Tax=Echria macrotheca TaxID=438768 RepID=A0AAJ0B7Q3_9PEZI|nr:nucleolar GTP-binding protein 1 [Echria macrotheca]
MAPVITLILIGPTGSGKSSFVKKAAKLKDEAIGIGKGLQPCTMNCEVYTFKHKETEFSLIDTPGLQDDPIRNFPVLKEIASQLSKSSETPWISGAVYFHPITDRRFGASNRLSLDIFRAICGESLFSRVISVTTMWDRLKREKIPEFKKLSDELRNDMLNFTGDGGVVYDLRATGDPWPGLSVLDHFAAIGCSKNRCLQLEKEVRSFGPSGFKKTQAGKEIKKRAKGACTIL